MTRLRRWLLRLALPALALAALANAGCLLVAAGAAAGAGAVAYTYYRGQLYREYHANLGDTQAAVRTGLEDLRFPIIEQKSDTGSAKFETRTADGQTVRIHLDVVPSPIPAEGALTRVSIRVGLAGDEAVSARILEQISFHLAPPGSAPPPRPSSAMLGAPRTPQSELRPAVYETPPPPLAEVAAPTRPAVAPVKGN